MPRHRRNPPLPAPPPRRGPPTATQTRSAIARVREIKGRYEDTERPFDPERAPTWRGSARDLVVNGTRMLRNGAELDEFTIAFLKTGLWSETDESRDDGGDPLDDNYTINDIETDSVSELAEDCRLFQEQNAEVLDGLDLAEAGHNFWLTRNEQGAGFWDGDYEEPAATHLTEASEAFGGVHLFVTEDGEKIYADFDRPIQRRGK